MNRIFLRRYVLHISRPFFIYRRILTHPAYSAYPTYIFHPFCPLAYFVHVCTSPHPTCFLHLAFVHKQTYWGKVALKILCLLHLFGSEPRWNRPAILDCRGRWTCPCHSLRWYKREQFPGSKQASRSNTSKLQAVDEGKAKVTDFVQRLRAHSRNEIPYQQSPKHKFI